MIDHANELRRHARKIPHPQGETPGVMLRAADEIERLRAKIEQMERQEPDAWTTKLALRHGANALGFDACAGNLWGEKGVPLYALPGAHPKPDCGEAGHDEGRCGNRQCLPGAQPAPSEQDASVRKAWARFSHELHRSPDAPYPGMADAFEQHFSQSFIDREWRAEAGTWAAAWKAAKRHCDEYASVGEIADAVVDLIVKESGK